MSNKFSQLYSEVGEHVSLKHCSNRCAMGQVSRRHGQGPVCTVTVLTPQSAKQWFQHPSLRGSSLHPSPRFFSRSLHVRLLHSALTSVPLVSAPLGSRAHCEGSPTLSQGTALKSWSATVVIYSMWMD